MKLPIYFPLNKRNNQLNDLHLKYYYKILRRQNTINSNYQNSDENVTRNNVNIWNRYFVAVYVLDCYKCICYCIAFTQHFHRVYFKGKIYYHRYSCVHMYMHLFLNFVSFKSSVFIFCNLHKMGIKMNECFVVKINLCFYITFAMLLYFLKHIKRLYVIRKFFLRVIIQYL